jgi:predicted AAA+ superfamily ATPase
MLRFIMANVSRETSYNGLAKMLGIKGKQTIQNWVYFASNAYLIFKIERFSFKLKEPMMAPKKIYAIDTGLAKAVAISIADSALLENAVAMELLRRKSYANAKIEINYWRDYSQHEVDFVIRNENKVEQLIQVTYASGEQEIKDRETSSLVIASKALRCNNLKVITWDYSATKKVEGKEIEFIPLWKWLLQP